MSSQLKLLIASILNYEQTATNFKLAPLIPMRIVCISDTHGQHAKLSIPAGDMLLHAGDFSNSGAVDEVRTFLAWFAAQPHRHKVFIAGNHDFFPEQSPKRFQKMIPENCVYLENEAKVIEGVTFWGSPITPIFYHWAFMRRRGEAIRPVWATIPADTDVLITHGPPHGILDRNFQGEPTGCEELRPRVLDISPKLHVFGHIHEGFGHRHLQGIDFLNVSSLDHHYKPTREPVVWEI